MFIMTNRKTRGFEVVDDKYRKYPNEEVRLPIRGDIRSAGYDFYALEDKVLNPGEYYMFWTDIKAYMLPDEVLCIHSRSSLGSKGINLMNKTGIIDSSYYSNPGNDGNIGIGLINEGDKPFKIKKGERIAQGIFMKYLIADNDNVKNKERVGGFGSSGR